jgi:transposase InsO family protein
MSDLKAFQRNRKPVLQPRKMNQVIVGDITYLPILDGSFCYLATNVDLFSRLVIGWEVADTMEEELIIKAFEKALRRRSHLRGAIVHSDRGGQYAGKECAFITKRCWLSPIHESGG